MLPHFLVVNAMFFISGLFVKLFLAQTGKIGYDIFDIWQKYIAA
jgi:hypothetical protein